MYTPTKTPACAIDLLGGLCVRHGDRAHSGAVGWNWQTQPGDPVRRDIPSKQAWEELLSVSGIGNDTCVILYGDSHNWFALKYLLGFPDVRNYDGSWTEWGNLIDAPIAR
jgi:thiosulfate/3-mercaptopyruvate sulfurtransferase